jgi:acetyltransferase-like isoleucine patch superfamily enzyme
MKVKQALRKRLRKSASMSLAAVRVYRWALGLGASLALFGRFPSVYIASDVRLIGLGRMRLGANVAIGRGSWLNVNDRRSPDAALVIGDNCFIGQRNFFSVGRSIVLRDYCLTALNCAFVGSSHCYHDPMSTYMTTGVTLDADIYVGANCCFGYGSEVIGHVRIGHGCVIGAGASIRENILPFSLVVGNPARVIKRFDFSSMQWVAWPVNPVTEGPSEDAYLEHLRQQHGFVPQPISVAARSFGNIP